MRKLLVILSMALFSTSLFAQTSTSDFIKTHEKTFFFKKIKTVDDGSFIGIKSDGERMEFGKEDVISYIKKGEYYEKMPVYENNVRTGEKDFMRVVENKKGMILLEYKYVDKVTGNKARKYYVIKGDKLFVEMDEKNESTLTRYFGVS